MLRASRAWWEQETMPDNTRVCTDCGRRYADPAIIEKGVCPVCGGRLATLEEDPYPDPNSS